MQDNTGSFGQGLGGIQALKNAAQRRGIDIPALEQVSASAPGGQAAPPDVPDQQMMTQSPQGQISQQSEQQAPFRSGESQIALKALADTVKSENTIAKQALKLAMPQPPQG